MKPSYCPTAKQKLSVFSVKFSFVFEEWVSHQSKQTDVSQRVSRTWEKSVQMELLINVQRLKNLSRWKMYVSNIQHQQHCFSCSDPVSITVPSSGRRRNNEVIPWLGLDCGLSRPTFRVKRPQTEQNSTLESSRWSSFNLKNLHVKRAAMVQSEDLRLFPKGEYDLRASESQIRRVSLFCPANTSSNHCEQASGHGRQNSRNQICRHHSEIRF